MKKIKIAIVDDHRIFLDGISSLLESDTNITVKFTSVNAVDALSELAKDADLDVVLSDISMDKMSGEELCVSIKKKYPQIAVLMLSMHKDIDIVKRVLSAGASGYILKNTDKKELISAIETIASGDTYYSESVQKDLIKSITDDKGKKASGKELLSTREIEVIKLIASEYTTQETADELFISPHTVESHRKNILRKTNARNMAGLIRYAIEHKIV
jgi:two-component system, NarL family, nitrate/nitrite response regulator NarL